MRNPCRPESSSVCSVLGDVFLARPLQRRFCAREARPRGVGTIRKALAELTFGVSIRGSCGVCPHLQLPPTVISGLLCVSPAQLRPQVGARLPGPAVRF